LKLGSGEDVTGDVGPDECSLDVFGNGADDGNVSEFVFSLSLGKKIFKRAKEASGLYPDLIFGGFDNLDLSSRAIDVGEG
jgi:hypothetical protein